MRNSCPCCGYPLPKGVQLKVRKLRPDDRFKFQAVAREGEHDALAYGDTEEEVTVMAMKRLQYRKDVAAYNAYWLSCYAEGPNKPIMHLSTFLRLHALGAL